ncbi:MAG: glutamate--tRNA ligase [Candidatus Omnitrophica bacterium]|nr:glutamate--tRNA ligase [Candidatus Omnitrophota bacterium]
MSTPTTVPAAAVKVRFAPSPTGYLHIGGARTALFNWMYARAQGGKFVLRVEDTDLERSKPEFEKEIMDSMAWLGLSWDEFYKQSERFALYSEYAEKLVAEGKAFRDGTAVILRVDKARDIKFDDLIRGLIVFNTDEIKDQVLMKSDGSPAYSFSCVVDDALMGITQVIRGEDHISNTPKQILMYEALGFKVPKFGHLPLIMGADGARLSKRFGAVAVSDYRKEGFIPEGLVNYLMLLGWSPGNQEILPLKNACEKFSIKKVNKTAAQFDMEKLKWVNAQYVKLTPTAKLTGLLIPILQEEGLLSEGFDRVWLERAVEMFKSRLNTLRDFVERAGFLFAKDFQVPDEVRAGHLARNMKSEFTLLAGRLGGLEVFDLASTEKVFRDVVAELSIASGELVHPVRVALSASAVGPGLFDIMVALGKERTVERLKAAFV